MARKASVRDVRRTNRGLVVRHLLLSGETSRGSVTTATGLSTATVNNVIAELINEGSVREGGFLDSEGGRRSAILGLDPDAAIIFGADVGESAIRVEAFDLTLNRLGSRRSDFPGRRVEPAHVMDVVAAHVDELLEALGRDRRSVLGLGLGVPGIVEHPAQPPDGRESIVHAQVIGWDRVVFTGLSERLGFPVYVDNGAKTTTQAESWYGSARDIEHAVVVIIGDGAGAGIITNGRLYRGSSSSAGEWGHTKISLDGIPCRCGSQGCVETFVGASAVLERWLGAEHEWTNRNVDGVEALFAAFRAGEPAARATIASLVTHLGLALSNLVNLYDPQKIIVGGWFGDRIAEELLPDLGVAVRRFSLEQPANEVVVERSTLGQEAVALGAATLPIDRFIETGWPASRRSGHP
jgi:predicted NBD/HSP70 family sugar kinase